MKNFGLTPQLATADCRRVLVKLHRWDFLRSLRQATVMPLSHAVAPDARRDHRTCPPFRRRYVESPTRKQL